MVLDSEFCKLGLGFQALGPLPKHHCRTVLGRSSKLKASLTGGGGGKGVLFFLKGGEGVDEGCQSLRASTFSWSNKYRAC